MEKDHGLIVEFLGLPGSGKTSLAQRVAALLRRENPLVYLAEPEAEIAHLRGRTGVRKLIRRVRLLSPTLRAAIRHPFEALRTTTLIAASGQRSAFDLAKVLNNWFRTVQAIEACRRVPGIHIFDQGLFQACWAVFFSAKKPEALRSRLATSSLRALPDIVVVIHTSIAEVEARLRKRAVPISRLETLLGTEPRALSVAAQSLRRVEHELHCLSDCERAPQIISAQNERDDALDANASRIATEISKSWGQRQAGATSAKQ